MSYRSAAIRVRLSLSIGVCSAIGAGLLRSDSAAAALPPSPQTATTLPRTAPTSRALPPAPKLEVRVLAVRVADDDGSYASTQTKEKFQDALDSANEIFARSGSRVHLSIDPASDFVGHLKSSLINHDCKLLKTEAQLAAITDPAYDTKLLCDREIVGQIKTAYALKYPDKVVVFLRYGSSEVKFDTQLGHWVPSHVKATGGYSSSAGYVVTLVASVGKGTFAAHELGHYFHSPHTFGGAAPATSAEAKAMIEAYIASRLGKPGFDPATDGLDVFDGDKVSDSPPDPQTKLFKNVYGNHCDPDHGSIDVTATVANKNYAFRIAPMRNNIMSYFKGCPWDMKLTPKQVALHHDSFNGNRKALLHPELVTCYERAGIMEGPAGWTPADLIERRLGIIDHCLNPTKIALPPVSLPGIRLNIIKRGPIPVVAPECN